MCFVLVCDTSLSSLLLYYLVIYRVLFCSTCMISFSSDPNIEITSGSTASGGESSTLTVISDGAEITFSGRLQSNRNIT